MSGSRSPESPSSPDRPLSPKAQVYGPEPGWADKIGRVDDSALKLKLKLMQSKSTMFHSASMPNLEAADGELSPHDSTTRSQSPVSQPTPSRPGSPVSPVSPLSGRHSVVCSPKQTRRGPEAEQNRLNIRASIENEIRSSMGDEYYLNSYEDILGRFHYAISIINGREVFKYSCIIPELDRIEEFVETFNRDCKLFQLNVEQIIRGCHQNHILLTPLKIEFGYAVFVTGEDEKLGSWKKALRMNHNQQRHAWCLILPAGMTQGTYKFLIGRYDLGRNPVIDTEIKDSNGKKLMDWEDLKGNRQLLPAQLEPKTPRLSK